VDPPAHWRVGLAQVKLGIRATDRSGKETDMITFINAGLVLGSAFVIHAKGDDYRSQPAGDSGDRIACAVIER